MNIGKKILSAFVEVSEDEKQKTATDVANLTRIPTRPASPAGDTGKFKQYFDKLFEEANIPGPDYFEFSKMISAMTVIPDERSRYLAAFAGLSVQGLDKQKLLSTAAQYLQVLDADAANFNSTIDAAMQEKVTGKKAEIEEKAQRIQQLSQEIADLQNKIAFLQNEITGNEEKIRSNSSGYHIELEEMKSRIAQDMQKVEQYL